MWRLARGGSLRDRLLGDLPLRGRLLGRLALRFGCRSRRR